MEANNILENDISTTQSSNNNSNLPRIHPPIVYSDLCKITLDLYTYIKIAIVLMVVVFLICNTIFSFALPQSAPECLNDELFNLSASLNNYFIQNQISRRVLLIVGSLLIDGVFFGAMIHWILVSRSWRFLFVLLIFYGTRAAVQATFQLGFPSGFNWVYPDFPSLVVGYGPTNDFFFSGHVGLPLIAALEFNKTKLNIPAVFCLLVCFLEAFLLIITRGHYSIDIFAGLIIGHYYFLLIDKYIDVVDTSIIGMKKEEEVPQAENEDNDYQKVKIIEDIETS